jgi:catechol 2,3-dioxygenase-like lactoylglutathione lyase family enzyme
MSISGAHVVLYSTNAEADRKFFRDVLRFKHVDAGGGWLIFALPPSEVAVHPTKSANEDSQHSLFLMCENLDATTNLLHRKRVKCRIVGDERWGKVAMITLPSGMDLGLYEPRHKLAHK